MQKEVTELVLEVIDQLAIHKRSLQSKGPDTQLESDPEQVDLFSENKVDALNYCHNLITEKFSEFLPKNSELNSSKEYDVFKQGISGALSELDKMKDELQRKKTNEVSHPSVFEKGIIEGIKRSNRVFRRTLNDFLI